MITLVLLASSLLAGYGCYRFFLRLAPMYFLSQPRLLASNIAKEAEKQSSRLVKQKPSQKKIQLAREELEEDIKARKESLNHETALLQQRHNELHREEQILSQKEQLVKDLEDRADKVKQQVVSTQSQWESSCESVKMALVEKAGSTCEEVTRRIETDYVHKHTLEYQKMCQFMESELNAGAKKKAEAVLANVHARYSPDFSWPKMSNVIGEIKKGDFDSLHSDQGSDSFIVEELAEMSGVDITAITDKTDRGTDREAKTETAKTETEGSRVVAMKFAGGFGIFREAAKLTLSEWLTQKKISANSFAMEEVYQKHLRKLNKQARMLGKKAITNLGLYDVHPELQYLIGSLNWRTSYRQNQWLHTMEVAVLAGILAEEIGEDASAAKRSGLLHDIGKALDYRIEGSHAVISGDYADRFGEDKLICDTVMSHHSDLVLENPLAFTLMAADTLSGARPGARVNIEEGYQLRLSSISDTVKSFPGVDHMIIMNGGREVHVSVNHQKVSERKARQLAREIADKIEEDVSYPSQIKVQISRVVQSQAVA